MSLAEDLLDTLSDDGVSDSTDSNDVEEPIIIDETRRVIVPDKLKTIAVTGDKDIETVTFKCIRYWDTVHDLSNFEIYINYILPNNTTGTYVPKITGIFDDCFTFDWVIGSELTAYNGTLTFLILARKVDNYGDLKYQWSSLLNSECNISKGLDVLNIPVVEVDYKSLLRKITERTITEITADDLAGLTRIGNRAFSCCANLEKITFPNTMKKVGTDAFVECTALREINFNADLQEIEQGGVRGCGVEEIVLPDALEAIRAMALADNKNLKKVTWAASAPTLYGYCFGGCPSMEYIDFTRCTKVAELANTSAIVEVPSTCVFYVPAERFDEWKSASNWSNFAEQITVKSAHFYLSNYNSIFGPYQFVGGMTWREFVESDYCAQITNDGNGIRISADGAVEISLGSDIYREIVCPNHGSNSDKADDLIEHAQTYYNNT